MESNEGRFGGHDRAQEKQEGTDVAGLQEVGGVGGDPLHVQLQGHLCYWVGGCGWFCVKVWFAKTACVPEAQR